MDDVKTKTTFRPAAGHQALKKPFRLFIGIEVPPKARNVIEGAMGAYRRHIEQVVPVERWHMTLLFLGECPDPKSFLAALAKPMPQQFLPTVSLTHVGRGLVKHHLWAYGLATPLLAALQSELKKRLQDIGFQSPRLAFTKPLVPHIHIANLKESAAASLPDELATVTFTVPALHLYRSEAVKKKLQYKILASIPL